MWRCRKKSIANVYPRIKALGIPVFQDRNVEYVSFNSLKKALKDKGITRKFHKLFGIQTCYELGLYPWDVEAVLEKMASGELIGSQLNWD